MACTYISRSKKLRRGRRRWARGGRDQPVHQQLDWRRVRRCVPRLPSGAQPPPPAAPRVPSGLQASPAANAPAADLALKLDLCHDRARGLPSSRRSVATPPREAAAAQEQAVQELRLPRQEQRRQQRLDARGGGGDARCPAHLYDAWGPLIRSVFWERRSGMDGEAVGSLTFCPAF